MFESLLQSLLGKPQPANALMRLHVRKDKNLGWVFNDKSRGLVDEPFVQGIDTILTRHCRELGITRHVNNRGLLVTFSGASIPNEHTVLERGEPESGGCWYHDTRFGMDGWLCPALFRYFKKAPEQIHVHFALPA